MPCNLLILFQNINMIRLSVNINKIATLRNARGGNQPNLIQVARDCEQFGADGITVHPRPDQRHIKYVDIPHLKAAINTELNIEGNPTKEFIQLVVNNKPNQVTLVPDDPGQLTSDHGWDTIKHRKFLNEIISEFKNAGIRTSIFVDPDLKMVEGAVETGADRIELYTESYAQNFNKSKEMAIEPFVSSAILAKELGLGLNAGHDLNLENLKYFGDCIPWLDEVSIGHALICDSLYFGMENTIQKYLFQLQ